MIGCPHLRLYFKERYTHLHFEGFKFLGSKTQLAVLIVNRYYHFSFCYPKKRKWSVQIFWPLPTTLLVHIDPYAHLKESCHLVLNTQFITVPWLIINIVRKNSYASSPQWSLSVIFNCLRWNGFLHVCQKKKSHRNKHHFKYDNCV